MGGEAAELIASQIPFLVERAAMACCCRAISRAPIRRSPISIDGGEVLAIFPGPHAYISPSWYEAGPAVPTWNYASVHAYGTARAIRDPEWLRDMLDRLSARHEAREAAPWRMRDLPQAYLESMLRGIVGIEIAVSRLEGKFKLSQNRPAADRPRIIAALERRDDETSREVAGLMRERETGGGVRSENADARAAGAGMTFRTPRFAVSLVSACCVRLRLERDRGNRPDVENPGVRRQPDRRVRPAARSRASRRSSRSACAPTGSTRMSSMPAVSATRPRAGWRGSTGRSPTSPIS